MLDFEYILKIKQSQEETDSGSYRYGEFGRRLQKRLPLEQQYELKLETHIEQIRVKVANKL